MVPAPCTPVVGQVSARRLGLRSGMCKGHSPMLEQVAWAGRKLSFLQHWSRTSVPMPSPRPTTSSTELLKLPTALCIIAALHEEL